MGRIFTYLWEYEVKSHNQISFLKLYGVEGDWVQFFNRADGYLGTEIHQDIDNQERFISIDYWKSKEARDNYQLEFSSEFDALDEEGELITENETSIGEFYINSNRFD